jgi:hypothetical protein
VEPTAACAQLQLGFVDHTRRRYEVIRPLGLFADRTATQRAQETQTHPDAMRKLARRSRQQSMLGLLPAHVEVMVQARASKIPDEILRSFVQRSHNVYIKGMERIPYPTGFKDLLSDTV